MIVSFWIFTTQISSETIVVIIKFSFTIICINPNIHPFYFILCNYCCCSVLFVVGQTNTTLCASCFYVLHASVLPRPAYAALTITRLYVQIINTWCCSYNFRYMHNDLSNISISTNAQYATYAPCLMIYNLLTVWLHLADPFLKMTCCYMNQSRCLYNLFLYEIILYLIHVSTVCNSIVSAFFYIIKNETLL